jgi:hypothetical protein
MNKYLVTYIDGCGMFHDIIATARDEETAKSRIATLGGGKWRILEAKPSPYEN